MKNYYWSEEFPCTAADFLEGNGWKYLESCRKMIYLLQFPKAGSYDVIQFDGIGMDATNQDGSGQTLLDWINDNWNSIGTDPAQIPDDIIICLNYDGEEYYLQPCYAWSLTGMQQKDVNEALINSCPCQLDTAEAKESLQNNNSWGNLTTGGWIRVANPNRYYHFSHNSARFRQFNSYNDYSDSSEHSLHKSYLYLPQEYDPRMYLPHLIAMDTGDLKGQHTPYELGLLGITNPSTLGVAFPSSRFGYQRWMGDDPVPPFVSSQYALNIGVPASDNHWEPNADEYTFQDAKYCAALQNCAMRAIDSSGTASDINDVWINNYIANGGDINDITNRVFFANNNDMEFACNGSTFEKYLEMSGEYDWAFVTHLPYIPENIFASIKLENLENDQAQMDAINSFFASIKGTWRKIWKYSLGLPPGTMVVQESCPVSQSYGNAKLKNYSNVNDWIASFIDNFTTTFPANYDPNKIVYDCEETRLRHNPKNEALQEFDYELLANITNHVWRVLSVDYGTKENVSISMRGISSSQKGELCESDVDEEWRFHAAYDEDESARIALSRGNKASINKIDDEKAGSFYSYATGGVWSRASKYQIEKYNDNTGEYDLGIIKGGEFRNDYYWNSPAYIAGVLVKLDKSDFPATATRNAFVKFALRIYEVDTSDSEYSEQTLVPVDGSLEIGSISTGSGTGSNVSVIHSMVLENMADNDPLFCCLIPTKPSKPDAGDDWDNQSYSTKSLDGSEWACVGGDGDYCRYKRLDGKGISPAKIERVSDDVLLGWDWNSVADSVWFKDFRNRKKVASFDVTDTLCPIPNPPKWVDRFPVGINANSGKNYHITKIEGELMQVIDRPSGDSRNISFKHEITDQYGELKFVGDWETSRKFSITPADLINIPDIDVDADEYSENRLYWYYSCGAWVVKTIARDAAGNETLPAFVNLLTRQSSPITNNINSTSSTEYNVVQSVIFGGLPVSLRNTSISNMSDTWTDDYDFEFKIECDDDSIQHDYHDWTSASQLDTDFLYETRRGVKCNINIYTATTYQAAQDWLDNKFGEELYRLHWRWKLKTETTYIDDIDHRWVGNWVSLKQTT